MVIELDQIVRVGNPNAARGEWSHHVLIVVCENQPDTNDAVAIAMPIAVCRALWPHQKT